MGILYSCADVSRQVFLGNISQMNYGHGIRGSLSVCHSNYVLFFVFVHRFCNSNNINFKNLNNFNFTGHLGNLN